MPERAAWLAVLAGAERKLYWLLQFIDEAIDRPRIDELIGPLWTFGRLRVTLGNLHEGYFELRREVCPLRLVAVAATGTNNVDLEAARAARVTVCNIRDYCNEAVAQHTMTLMLNLLTGQPWYRDRVRRGEWSVSRQFCLQDRPIREARGLYFGVIGYGGLGRAVAAKAAALGLNVLVAERKGQPLRAGRTALEEVLMRADVISIHCPLTDATHNLLGPAELQLMKRDAILLNAARGGVVDEEALADSLRAGIIGGAGVDTLSVEPPPPDHPLLASDIPNLLLTPHNAWASRSARQAALDQLAAVVAGFAAGDPLNVVT